MRRKRRRGGNLYRAWDLREVSVRADLYVVKENSQLFQACPVRL
jgi:hypothetical protein